MNINDAFPSNYLKASDVASDTNMLISHITQETVGQGRDADQKPIIYFHGMAKGLVLNKTNATTIAKLYGPDTDQWKGKAITLYATEVEFQGETVMAIRVRLRAPSAGVPSEAPSPTPTAPKVLAYTAFLNKTKGADKDAQIAQWRQVLADAYPGVEGRLLTDQQWTLLRKRIESEFDPSQGKLVAQPSPISDDPRFTPEELPFDLGR
jgi:hypothetical protein